MIDKKDFARLRKEIKDKDLVREKIIALSREIIRMSKLAIYAVHRNDMNKAAKVMDSMKKKKEALMKINNTNDTNIGQTALQEYVEAFCYYGFMKNNKIPPSTAVNVCGESYLLGICDLSGELVRKAVDSVIKGNVKDAERIKDVVDEMDGMFLQFDLRNGELRKKSDSIKWNLKKLEEVLFDAKLKR